MTIVTDTDAFVTAQNKVRGSALAGGGTLPLDYDALTGTVPAGGNAVTGISGIATGAAAVALPSSQLGNAVIIDGGVSTTASTSGAHSYSFLVGTDGTVTVTDNNTGNSQTVTGASYLLFNGAATTSTGAYQSAYLIESGTSAEIASMYNAAFERVPDFAGLEFYAIPTASGAMSLHQAAIYFLASPEFATHYPALTAPADKGGPNDQAFINQLYGQILHRTPTASEVNFYVQALQGTLTNGSGQTLPAADRAQLLIYFSVSPENQADISAAKGGWLINPSNGSMNFGAMSSAAATSVLASEAAGGTINASDFSSLSSSSSIGVTVTGGDIGIVGSTHNAGSAAQQADAEVSSTAPNITINLSSQYILAGMYGLNNTINGAATGGSIVITPSAYPAASVVNNGGTINFSGNVNWVQVGNDYYASATPTVINGWNSTDIIVGPNSAYPYYGASAAPLLANPDGNVLTGSASNPLSGASISTSTVSAVAINVGAIANDTVAAIVSAANSAFHENGNYMTNNLIESTFFFGQDPQGNTMVWSWRGDGNHAGTVQASDITGGVELVGVQASSLISTNFHH